MWDKITEIAKSGRPRIAIGLTKVNPEIENILDKASQFADIIVMGQDVPGYESEPKATAHEAVAALKNGRIDGLVLGGFCEPDVETEIETQFKVRFIQILSFRREERCFFMVPLAVSGRESVKDRLEMTEKTIQIIRQLGQEPKIGVLSHDPAHLGNDSFDDKILTEATYLVHHLAQTGVAIQDYAYRVNRAVEDDCNLIVTPNALASNLIGTTLFLAGYTYTGGPALFDHVYMHTSGTLQEKTYLDSIIFATALANLRKQAAMP